MIMVIIRYDSCLYYKDNGCPLYGVPVSVLCVLCFGGVCLLAFFSLVLFDEVYAGGADYQHDSCQHKHIDFRSSPPWGVNKARMVPPKAAAIICGIQIVPLKSPR